jgi:hypothetical protein
MHPSDNLPFGFGDFLTTGIVAIQQTLEPASVAVLSGGLTIFGISRM